MPGNTAIQSMDDETKKSLRRTRIFRARCKWKWREYVSVLTLGGAELGARRCAALRRWGRWRIDRDER